VSRFRRKSGRRRASKDNEENKEEQMKLWKRMKTKEGARKGIRWKRRLRRVEEEGEDKNNCYVQQPTKDT
jgi:hypothetical protein